MTGLDWMYAPCKASITSTITKPLQISSKAHPGNEAPWDSPIESPEHPLYDHDYQHLHHNCDDHHIHMSGASSPHSNAGFEAPWDSPILVSKYDGQDGDEEGTLTPLSEMEEQDYLSKEAAAACFSPHPHSTTHVPALVSASPTSSPDPHISSRNNGTKIRQSRPMHSAHPPLGSSNGAFATQMAGRVDDGSMGCGLRDSGSRAEFLWHISGVCGCGRQPALVAVMTPKRQRRNSFCEQ